MESGAYTVMLEEDFLGDYIEEGDPLEMDNCRGISLLPMPFKILLIMVTTRIEKCLEKRGILTRERLDSGGRKNVLDRWRHWWRPFRGGV